VIRRRHTSLAAILVAAAAAGCGSGSDPGSPRGPALLKVTLTDKGCSPKKLAAKAGAITFVVANGGTKRASEVELRKPNGVILGEKEHIVGDVTGTFTLELDPGRYVLACPLPEGGGNATLVVTGKG
jgi:iron uptake system component EfeO